MLTLGEGQVSALGVARRSILKRALHRVGLTALLHRGRNRRTLTVVGFHRVLAAQDPRWPEADPEWTVARELFGECLDFFARHYCVLGLAELLEARRFGRRLPDRSLLISFDDGWADTEDTALGELRARGMPAVVFVAAQAVGRREPFWREALEAALRRGRLGPEGFDALWRAAGGRAGGRTARPDAAALIRALEALEPRQREQLLAERAELASPIDSCAMVSPAQLRALQAGGVAIGSHGVSHEPLDRMEDAAEELAGSRAELARSLEREPEEGPRAFSFPHGRFRPEQLAQAAEAGYELVFTSAEHLNALGERGLPAVLGRICVDGRQVSGPDGRLAPELLALWLFRRPIAGR